MTGKKFSDLSPAAQAAALRTATDGTIQNPRANELRQQIVDIASEDIGPTSSPDELSTALGLITAIEIASKGPPRRAPR